MSNRPPDDDPTLLPPEDDEETAFPASENLPGQRESRSGYARMQALVGELLARKDAPEWWTDYLELRAEGWDWRKAVFISWSASPTVGRWPATQEELAQNVLGLKSDRVISKWKADFPEMQLRIEKLAAAPYLKHLRDIVDAGVTAAKIPDSGGFQDRRLAYEITGLYKPKQAREISGPDGGPIETVGAQVVVFIPENGRETPSPLTPASPTPLPEITSPPAPPLKGRGEEGDT